MPLTLFWGSGSPFAWRVQLALAVKGLDYESKLLSFANKETRTPEFLAINPRGKVPVLRNGGFTVRESLAILFYLDRQYPAPPLFGANPQDGGRIMEAIGERLNYLEAPLLVVARAVFFGEPEPASEAAQTAAKTVLSELRELDESLRGRTWLATDTISAADIFVFPLVQLFLRAVGKEQAAALNLGIKTFATSFAALDAWIKRVEALPGYEKTYPPHWRDA